MLFWDNMPGVILPKSRIFLNLSTQLQIKGCGSVTELSYTCITGTSNPFVGDTTPISTFSAKCSLTNRASHCFKGHIGLYLPVESLRMLKCSFCNNGINENLLQLGKRDKKCIYILKQQAWVWCLISIQPINDWSSVSFNRNSHGHSPLDNLMF